MSSFLIWEKGGNRTAFVAMGREAGKFLFWIFLLTRLLVVCKIAVDTQEPGVTAIPLPPPPGPVFLCAEDFGGRF